MKIVYFIDHLRPDGTQTVLKQLVQGFSKVGYQQAVVCLNDSWDQRLFQDLQASGAIIRIVGKHRLILGYGLINLAFWLMKNKFDVAITFLFFSDVIGRTLSKITHIPRLISSIQNRNTNYARWQRILLCFTTRWVDAFHVCSQSILDFSVTYDGVDPEKAVVIPHSIDINGFPEVGDGTILRAEFGLPPIIKIIGSLGRLHPQKGYDVLIEAFSFLNDEDIFLIIAGVGDEKGALTEQAQGLSISDRVHFSGHIRDVPSFLYSLDLYVQPSRNEGMPLAVLEAMAASRPIVASAVDGICELIQDGVHGWLVPPQDPKILANNITAALYDRQESVKRGQAARQRVIQQFTLQKMIDRWDSLISHQ
jgi:glycosyltransferase involved in cell wall biosynthesis